MRFPAGMIGAFGYVIRLIKTAEEFVTLAQTEGIELTDEQLDALSGGSDWDWLYG